MLEQCFMFDPPQNCHPLLVDELRLILKEACYLVLLSNESEINKIREVIVDKKKIYVVMEYAEFGNLHEFIKNNKDRITEE